MNRKSVYLNVICSVMILFVFAISAMILINVGGRVYKNIAASNTSTYKLRTSLSYVATKIRQMDTEGGIYFENRKGVNVLVMQQKIEDKAYETLIYFYRGKVYEVFHEKNGEFELAGGGYGYEITQVDSFTMIELNNNLLQLTAADGKGNEESLILNLRSRR